MHIQDSHKFGSLFGSLCKCTEQFLWLTFSVYICLCPLSHIKSKFNFPTVGCTASVVKEKKKYCTEKQQMPLFLCGQVYFLRDSKAGSSVMFLWHSKKLRWGGGKGIKVWFSCKNPKNLSRCLVSSFSCLFLTTPSPKPWLLTKHSHAQFWNAEMFHFGRHWKMQYLCVGGKRQLPSGDNC